MRNTRKQQISSEGVGNTVKESAGDYCVGVGEVTNLDVRLTPEKNCIYIEGYRDGYKGRARKFKNRDSASTYNQGYKVGRTERLIEIDFYEPQDYQRVRALAKLGQQEDYGDELFYNHLMEQEPREQEAEAGELSVSIKETREGIEKLISSDTILEEKKLAVLNIIRDISEACRNNIPLEEILQQKVSAFQSKEVLEAPDLSEIPLWQGRKLDGMALEFIKVHYGQWLSAFGAKEDSVFQDQIRAHNFKLMQGVRTQLHEEGKGRKVSDFVKPRVARTKHELASMDADALRRVERIRSLLRRQHKNSKKAAANT